MKSRFLNFGDEIHDRSVRVRITATVQKVPPRLSVLDFPSCVWSPILNCATSPRVRERTGLFLCPKYRRRPGKCLSCKIPWAPRAGINFPSRHFGTSHLCMFGVKDPRSRRVVKRPVRYLTYSREHLKFVVRKCSNKHVHGPVKGLTNAHRRSSRWHTRAWGQAVVRGAESDAAKRFEAY